MTAPGSHSDIQLMKHAGTLVRECFLVLGKELRPGSGAARLRETANRLIAEHGGSWSPPLDCALSIAVNDRLLGAREDQELKAGDVVTLDLAACFNGWWADCAVALPVGQIGRDTGRLIRAAREISRCVTSHIRNGVEWAIVARQARQAAELQNLKLVTSLFGHGIGRELHESPRLGWAEEPNSDAITLETGMKITIEPALTPGSGALLPSDGGGLRTDDGQPLVWFEETVAVTESGGEILTSTESRADERNVILIGMPGTGKSTVGHALAERLGRPFVDLDALIEGRQGRSLEEIIHDVGLEAFLDLEAEAAINFDRRETVLATGGSVVYRPEAMLALQQAGTIVFLHTPLEELERRVSDLKQRGVVVEETQSLADLFHQREPLYECWYDLKIETAGHSVEETVHAIINSLELNPP